MIQLARCGVDSGSGARSWGNVEVIQLLRVTLVLIVMSSTTDHWQNRGGDQHVRVTLDAVQQLVF